VIHPQGNVEMILTEMRGKHNEAVDVAAGSGILVKIPLANSFLMARCNVCIAWMWNYIKQKMGIC
jgi:hypothetical protein